uniref:Uncharacterized protein n=1 Tax=Anguilla anguilla TaxID=7936 RepID=A0A0E9UJL4_ANGAN
MGRRITMQDFLFSDPWTRLWVRSGYPELCSGLGLCQTYLSTSDSE